MSDYKDAVNFVKAWEGGLSAHPADSASNLPSPCGTDSSGNPYHTNKGITWATYTSSVSNPTCEEFMSMPEDVWLKIWKERYWDRMGADKIENQGIANTVTSWAWGSGVGGARSSLRKFLNGLGYSNSQLVTADEIVNALNAEYKRNPLDLFDGLYEHRLNFFKSLSSWPTFGSGWSNRLADYKTFNSKYIGQDGKGAAFIATGALFLGSAAAVYFTKMNPAESVLATKTGKLFLAFLIVGAVSFLYGSFQVLKD